MHRIRARRIPELRFVADATIAYSVHISKCLNDSSRSQDGRRLRDMNPDLPRILACSGWLEVPHHEPRQPRRRFGRLPVRPAADPRRLENGRDLQPPGSAPRVPLSPGADRIGARRPLPARLRRPARPRLGDPGGERPPRAALPVRSSISTTTSRIPVWRPELDRPGRLLHRGARLPARDETRVAPTSRSPRRSTPGFSPTGIVPLRQRTGRLPRREPSGPSRRRSGARRPRDLRFRRLLQPAGVGSRSRGCREATTPDRLDDRPRAPSSASRRRGDEEWVSYRVP